MSIILCSDVKWHRSAESQTADTVGNNSQMRLAALHDLSLFLSLSLRLSLPSLSLSADCNAICVTDSPLAFFWPRLTYLSFGHVPHFWQALRNWWRFLSEPQIISHAQQVSVIFLLFAYFSISIFSVLILSLCIIRLPAGPTGQQ